MSKLTALARRFRPTYNIYNLFHPQKLQHVKEAYRRLGLKKAYYSTIRRSDFAHLPEEKPWLDKLDSQKELQKQTFFKTLKPAHQQSLQGWSKNGYAILEGFFSEKEIEAINLAVEDKVASKDANWKWYNKIFNAYKESKTLNGVVRHLQLTKILSMLLGKSVFPFQSLNFIQGSEQATHSDSIHMTTFPLGYMTAVWIALEDVKEGSGLLHYYPGSHHLPYVLYDDFLHGGNDLFLGAAPYKAYEEKIAQVVDSHDFEKKNFLPKKGDLLIWHANLLHGGDPITLPNATRKSMVVHYFTEEVVCYHSINQRPALID